MNVRIIEVYRDYEIFNNDFDAHPDWRTIQYGFSHKDYNGPDPDPQQHDNRCGYASSLEECRARIDELIADEEA